MSTFDTEDSSDILGAARLDQRRRTVFANIRAPVECSGLDVERHRVATSPSATRAVGEWYQRANRTGDAGTIDRRNGAPTTALWGCRKFVGWSDEDGGFASVARRTGSRTDRWRLM